MVLALVAGYGGLAARFAAFLVSLVAAIGAIYLLCALERFFTSIATPRTGRARRCLPAISVWARDGSG